MSLIVLTATAGSPVTHQNLEYVPLEGMAEIHARANEVYSGCERVRVFKDRVTCWFHGRRVDLDRAEILRITVSGKIYSDLGLLEAEGSLQKLPSPQQAKEIDIYEDCRKKISTANLNAAEKSRARNCGDAREFAENTKEDINFFFIVSTPANILPSMGLAIGSNFYSDINFGFSIEVSGQFITAGILYAQGHIYWNYRFSPANYIGFKLGLRSIDISSPVNSQETSPDSPNYFSAFTRAKMTQFSIPTYYGWQFTPRDSMELGIDIGIRTRSNVSFDDQYLSEAAKNNPALKPEIQRAVDKASAFLAIYEKITWVYVAYVHRF